MAQFERCLYITGERAREFHHIEFGGLVTMRRTWRSPLSRFEQLGLFFLLANFVELLLDVL